MWRKATRRRAERTQQPADRLPSVSTYDILLNMEEMRAVETLSALAHPTRLAVFRFLLRVAPEGRAAGVVAQELGIAPATLSFHLAELRRSGLIVSRRESRSIMYAANDAAMRDLLGYLMEDCCQGRPEICAPFLSVQPLGRVRAPMRRADEPRRAAR
jgi:DNA-binding transcriptional ArsR family regulator